MSKFIVEKLKDELSQGFSYSLQERVHIAAFIPYLYIHNASADYFTFELSSSSGVIFSKNFTVGDIKSSIQTAENFMHVFYPIVATNPVQLEKGSYTITVIAGPNYTPSNDSFLGWIKQHEDLQNELDYLPETDNDKPLAFRLKYLKEGVYA